MLFETHGCTFYLKHRNKHQNEKKSSNLACNVTIIILTLLLSNKYALLETEQKIASKFFYLLIQMLEEMFSHAANASH